jgi:hypothetical protein
LYQSEKFRQYKWYAYINKKRTEDNMLNKIENKYGKYIKIIIGDLEYWKTNEKFYINAKFSNKKKIKNTTSTL